MKLRFVTLISLVAPLYTAAANGDDNSVLIEKDNAYIKIETDGSYTDTIEQQYLLNEERALKLKGQQYLYLNKQLDKLISLEAYTIKPDGRKITVAQDQIKTQADPASLNAPMFNDSEYKVVIFPELAIGDRTYFKFSRKRSPMFPGFYSDFTIPQFHPYKESTIQFDAPSNMQLSFIADGYKGDKVIEENARKIYAWHYELMPKHRIEAGSISYRDYGNRLEVSSFKDYAAIAHEYEKVASTKSMSTDKIAELATDLTKNASTQEEKAITLANWVRKNIRYVAIYLGRGGVVPHAADDVLSNRYGDCKDHTTLLEAMLAAVGIESTTALINSTDSYSLPAVPVWTAFNHAITYVPSLNLYLDTTAVPVEAGYLPPLLLDKPVLLTKSGVISRTPIEQRSELKVKIDYSVNENGNIKLQAKEDLIGWTAELTRYQFRNLTREMKDNYVSALLHRNNFKGNGYIDLDKDQGNTHKQSVNYNADLSGYINLPGTTGVQIVSSLGGGMFAAINQLAVEENRTQPFMCFSGKITEEVNYQLPPKVKVIDMPKSLSHEDKYFSYQSKYRLNGKILNAKREIASKPLGTVVCQPDAFKAMQPSLELIQRDLKAQFVIKG
ncbi:DUF3857 domain-containing transglutaminase family protein [Chitinimonas sp. PSY-7]|uniref:DUF3857 domain-containing protein n=1 Tax=Chitinimonas sp. PSY-7 TaxID=3459088 RepID=UPI0040400EA3